MSRMVEAAGRGRIAAPRVLRLIAAGGPDPARGGEVRFHPRLTVLASARPALADWVTSLVGAHAAPDTLLALDEIPARTYDLPRALRALPAPDPFRVDTLKLVAAGLEPMSAERAMRRRAHAHAHAPRIADDLARWLDVRREARHRLAAAHAAAARVDPVDLAEASRLRDELRYAVHLDARERRRRSRREVHRRRERFEAFLARFGASSFEDLSTVGTGFGDTPADLAIREAATVVSMAEHRGHTLRAALDEARRGETSTSRERIAAEVAAHELDPGELDAERVDRLMARALADCDDTAYVRPIVIDRVLDVLSPAARRRGYDRLLAHARRRQIVLVTSCDDVARWAAGGARSDVSLHVYPVERRTRTD